MLSKQELLTMCVELTQKLNELTYDLDAFTNEMVEGLAKAGYKVLGHQESTVEVDGEKTRFVSWLCVVQHGQGEDVLVYMTEGYLSQVKGFSMLTEEQQNFVAEMKKEIQASLG